MLYMADDRSYFFSIDGNREVDRKYLSSVGDGDLDRVRASLAEGADPLATSKAPGLVKVVDSVIRGVLELQAKVQQQEATVIGIASWTALHVAARRGHPAIVEFLLKQYPELMNILDQCQANALFWADKDCIPILLQNNASVVQKDVFGQNPLFTVLYTANLIGVRLIVEQMVTYPRAEHMMLHTFLKPFFSELHLINLMSEYIGRLDQDDVAVPAHLCKYIPGFSEFNEKDDNRNDRAWREKVNSLVEFFREYGINLSECRVIKEAPH